MFAANANENKSDHVVRLNGESNTANSFYLVFDAYNCGTLAQLISSRGFISENAARTILK